MVNVPGRSKGCNTCRRRKKGCDYRRPTCLRCEQEGHECLGYERSTIWVTYDPKSNDRNTTTSRPEPSIKKSPSPPSLKQRAIIKKEQSPPLPPISIWPTELEKAQGELVVLESFLHMYVPTKVSIPGTTPKTWSSEWKDVIVYLSSSDSLVRRTAAALGLSCLGQEGSNTSMIKQGNKLYGVALSQLNEALSHPANREVAGNANILAAIGLMGLYEQFNGFSPSDSRNQSRNWQAHVLGVRKLLEVLGPEAFRDDDQSFLMYQAAQMSQFTAAFASRKGTFLSSRKWRTVPWIGREKNARDLFFDIAFSLPGLVEEAEFIDGSTPENDVLSLLDRLHQIMARIEIWKVMCGMGDPVDGSYMSGETGLRDPLDYDLADRQTAVLFAAVHVHIAVVMHRLASELNPETFFAVPDATPYALWIAQTIPTIAIEGGVLGSQSVLFPIGAVRWWMGNFAKANPAIGALVGRSLAQATQHIGYFNCLDGFLKSVPSIRFTTDVSSTRGSASHPGYWPEKKWEIDKVPDRPLPSMRRSSPEETLRGSTSPMQS